MAQDMRPPTSCGATDTMDAGNGYIVHQVSKLDTLAGVAIKYGVEVADVKRLNGLVTDLQMFAHKTLRIPIGRRHPIAFTAAKAENESLPGCSLSSMQGSNLRIWRDTGNNHEKRGREMRPLSLAMGLLRGYYGLSSPAQQADGNDAGMQMASYKAEFEHSDDEPFSPLSATPLDGRCGYWKLNGTHNSKLSSRGMDGESRSEVNGQVSQTNVVQIFGAGDAASERAVRRRFKPDATNPPSEMCTDAEIKQDASTPDRMLPVSGVLGGMESSGGLPVTLLKVLDGALTGGKGKEGPLLKVRKSSSTSNLQDQTSPQVHLGVQKYGVKVDVKSGSPLYQSGMKSSSDLPPKVLNYRFKAALD